MTLQQVAERCRPPTTPQTIGRLETGTRTVSVKWLNRIADALEVDAAELVSMPDRTELPLIAALDADGVHALPTAEIAVPPRPEPAMVALRIEAGVGDYRAGDEVWLRRLEPANYVAALNRDLLVPRPDGRFLFGRLLGREGGLLHILPLGAGQRQAVVSDPPWAAVATKLVRPLQ